MISKDADLPVRQTRIQNDYLGTNATGTFGVQVATADARNNVVRGNAIGTDGSGVRALPNGRDGVAIMAVVNDHLDRAPYGSSNDLLRNHITWMKKIRARLVKHFRSSAVLRMRCRSACLGFLMVIATETRPTDEIRSQHTTS